MNDGVDSDHDRVIRLEERLSAANKALELAQSDAHSVVAIIISVLAVIVSAYAVLHK